MANGTLLLVCCQNESPATVNLNVPLLTLTGETEKIIDQCRYKKKKPNISRYIGLSVILVDY